MRDYQSYKREKALNTRYYLLKNWYGKERADIEMAAHSPQPVSIADAIRNVCREMGNAENGTFVEIVSNWETIVQQPIASYAMPKRLENGVLTLQVRHSALLFELKPSLDLILKRLQEKFGKEKCVQINLIAGGGGFRRVQR